MRRADPDLSPLARAARPVAGVVVVGALAWALVHGARGVDLAGVARLIGQVGAQRLLALTALWLAGPMIYAMTLAAAMPGLGWRRALVLNLTGSTVANVVPAGGGAAGSALNLGMCRRWGHDSRSFTAYFLLTNALDVAAKLLLPPAAALIAVTAPGEGGLAPGMSVMATASAVALGALGVAAGLAWRASAGITPAIIRRPRLLGRLAGALRGSTELIAARVRGGWPRLAVGSLGYVAAQAVLLHACLAAAGVHAPWSVAVMATGIERLGAIIPLTASGAGFAEAGAVAWLVAAGQPAEQAIAAVLLYRLLVVGASTATGGVILGAMALRHPRTARWITATRWQ